MFGSSFFGSFRVIELGGSNRRLPDGPVSNLCVCVFFFLWMSREFHHASSRLQVLPEVSVAGVSLFKTAVGCAELGGMGGWRMGYFSGCPSDHG